MSAGDDFDRVARLAGKLGLSGVLILSPVCPKCGMCHDFMVGSDFSDDDALDLIRLVGRKNKLGMVESPGAHSKDH